jgi:protein-disulfide isomerase
MMHKQLLLLGGVTLGALALVAFLILVDDTPTYQGPHAPRAIAGNPEATVRVIKFADYQCPACASANQVMNVIKNQYGDKVAIENRHFPLPMHRHARSAAEAAECANDQGKFWEYNDFLYDNQLSISPSLYTLAAQRLGLDTAQFQNCIDSRAKQAIVEVDIEEARARKVNATPTFFLNDVQVQDWTELPRLVENAVSSAATK